MANSRRWVRFFRVGPVNMEPRLVGEGADIITEHMDSPSSRRPGDVWKHLEGEEHIDLGDLALARGLINDEQLSGARNIGLRPSCARPKSRTETFPRMSIIRFCGLMSPWMTPCPCA